MRVLHVLPHRGGGAETYLDLLERLDGISQRRFPLAAARTPLAAAPSIARRYPALITARADLVHAHGDMAAMLALPVLAARRSVWTTHGLHALRRRPALARAVAAVIAATRVTLCCSHAERDELAALTPHHDRLRVVPNGVDVPPPGDRDAARAELGLTGRVALFVGELEDRKDPLTAGRAAEAAGVTLLVAGDGPLRGELEGLPGVRVLGPRDDVDRLLLAADAFILPSRREGLSFAVLEAMARGLAMIVSDGPGNPEAVGEAGVVVGVGDVEGFAAALRRDDLAALGAAARERVSSEFPVSRLLDGVRAAYGA